MNRSALLVALVLLSGCRSVPSKTVLNVRAFGDETRNFTGRTFATTPVGRCAGQKRLERKLLAHVREQLVRKGLRESTDSPDFDVTIECSVKDREFGRRKESTSWRVPPFNPPPAPDLDVEYATAFEINLEVSITEPRPDGRTVAWFGSIRTEVPSRRLGAVGPVLLEELFAEFPRPSGEPSTRIVKRPAPVVK